MESLPKVLLVGGHDVNARIDLIKRLRVYYEIMAAGSSAEIASAFDKDNIEYFVYPAFHEINVFQNIRAMLSLYGLFRKVKPSIVHTFDTKPNVWARLAARLAGVPIIIGTVAGLGILYTNDRQSTRLIRAIYERLQKLSSSLSSATVFQNRDDYQQFVNAKIVELGKSHIIFGSGVATSYFAEEQISAASQSKLRNEFSVCEDGVVVCMIARLIRTKGVLDYAQVAASIVRENPCAKFLLIGPYEASDMDSLNAAELDRLQRSVIWAGKRNDIRDILSISDVFVLPSAYREGIPRVLLEAASMSLPLVATDAPGCREVIVNDQNGYLVQPFDVNELTIKINGLIQDTALRMKFGAQSRHAAVEAFDLSIVSRKTNQLYADLLSKHSLQKSI